MAGKLIWTPKYMIGEGNFSVEIDGEFLASMRDTRFSKARQRLLNAMIGSYFKQSQYIFYEDTALVTRFSVGDMCYLDIEKPAPTSFSKKSIFSPEGKPAYTFPENQIVYYKSLGPYASSEIFKLTALVDYWVQHADMLRQG